MKEGQRIPAKVAVAGEYELYKTQRQMQSKGER